MAFISFISEASVTRQVMLASLRGHAAILRPPILAGSAADPVLPAEVRNWHAVLALFQNRKDLSVSKSRFLHVVLRVHQTTEKSNFLPNGFWG